MTLKSLNDIVARYMIYNLNDMAYTVQAEYIVIYILVSDRLDTYSIR